MAGAPSSKSKLYSRLLAIDATQPVIQSLSSYFQVNSPSECCVVWMQVVESLTPEKEKIAMPLLYLANDVLLRTKTKTMQFVQEFAKHLPVAIGIISSVIPDQLDKIHRVIDIWLSREVYSVNFINKLKEVSSEKSSSLNSKGVSKSTTVSSSRPSSSSDSSHSVIELLSELQRLHQSHQIAKLSHAKIPSNIQDNSLLNEFQEPGSINSTDELEKTLQEITKHERLSKFPSTFFKLFSSRISSSSDRLMQLLEDERVKVDSIDADISFFQETKEKIQSFVHDIDSGKIVKLNPSTKSTDKSSGSGNQAQAGYLSSTESTDPIISNDELMSDDWSTVIPIASIESSTPLVNQRKRPREEIAASMQAIQVPAIVGMGGIPLQSAPSYTSPRSLYEQLGLNMMGNQTQPATSDSNSIINDLYNPIDVKKQTSKVKSPSDVNGFLMVEKTSQDDFVQLIEGEISPTVDSLASLSSSGSLFHFDDEETSGSWDPLRNKFVKKSDDVDVRNKEETWRDH
jgi:CID domain